jgi:spore maturation protein CgeB
MTSPGISPHPSLKIKPRILLSAPDNRPWAIGRYLQDALEQLEVPVRLFDFRSADQLIPELKKQLEVFKPELHLLFKGELFDRESIGLVKRAGVPTVLWHHDVHLDLPAWLMEVAAASDVFFTHARGMVPRFKQAGIPHTEWLSEGFPERFFNFQEMDEEEKRRYACQVTLTGNIHMNPRYLLRAAMIDRAIREGYTVKWWGPRISRKLKNLSLIWSRAGRAYGGGFVANTDFAKAVNCAHVYLARDVHPEVEASVSNRLYWACGSGAFYLSYTAQGIEDIMEPGREIETFTSLDEMAEKIRFYLDHPEERKGIARAGKKRVLENYTFRHRLAELIERVHDQGVL